MSEKYFKVMELPVRAIEPAALREIYLKLRTEWFLRQYSPEHLLEARDRLAEIEEAYNVLQDPRRQRSILRRIEAEQRREQEDGEAQRDEPSTAPPSPGERVGRHQLVRALLRTAEKLVARSGRPLTDQEKRMLAAAAYQKGLDFPDASQIVDQIAAKVRP